MKCPFCQHPNTQVADSRWLETPTASVRRRKCLECGQRFSTFETVEMRMPQVIKSNSTRVPSMRTNCRPALSARCTNALSRKNKSMKPLPLSSSASTVWAKKKSLHASSAKMAMEELAKIDQVAYVRFASVYKSFKDVSEFTQVIAECKAK